MADRPSNGTLRSFIDYSNPDRPSLMSEARGHVFKSGRGQITNCGAENYVPYHIAREGSLTLLMVAPRYAAGAPDQPLYVGLLLRQQLDDQKL